MEYRFTGESRQIGNYNPWSMKEIKFLKENYGTMTAKEIGKKLGRSTSTVFQQARNYGCNKVYNPWNSIDIYTLRKYYPLMKAKNVQPLLGAYRSVKEIQRKACELKIKKEK